MNKVIILLLVSLTIACNGRKKGIDDIPNTIESRRDLLNQKKEELKQLEMEIAALTDDIIKNDPSLEKKKKLVTTMFVSNGSFTKYIELEGIVIADETVNVVSETPGRIISLRVKEGDYVKKGALIAKIDLESFERQKDEINKSLELARDIYERQSKLWAQNIGSEVQYLQAKNNKERLEKSLELINHQLSKANIYAPMSGVVDKEFIKLGEVANPGNPIVRILNVKDVKVQVDLPERYLVILKKGMKVEVNFPSLNLKQKGRVSLLGRSIDPANRTLRFEVDISNPGGILKPNLLAELRMVEKSFENVISLPLEIIQQDVDGNEYVIKVVQDGEDYKAEKVNVKVGAVYENQALIEEGLMSGDNLVKDGARLLMDGETIILSELRNSEDE